MQPPVSLIGAPTDIGAGSRGASMGPEALRVAQLQATLESLAIDVIDRGNLHGPANPCLPPVNGYRHLAEVTAWNTLVRDAVQSELESHRLPVLLGGDHSLAIGSISAVARYCRTLGRQLRCSGWTPMRISTPTRSHPAAICTACRLPALAAAARGN